MANSFFITGTGTGIGKTVVTCTLARQLRSSGYNVAAIKPVISGWSDDDICDTYQILKSLGMACSQENIAKISPWRFKAPLAPSMAAKMENREINYAELVDFCKTHINHTNTDQPNNPLSQRERGQADYTETKQQQFLLCEGAGGVIVPLNDNKTTLDLMHDLQFPVILVAGTYLGAISHTLTAIKTLEGASSKIQAIIVNESGQNIGLDETIFELQKFTRHKIYKLHKAPHSHVGFAWENTDNLLQCLF